MIKNWLDKIPVADVEEQTDIVVSENPEITHSGVRFRVVETYKEVYCSVYLDGDEVGRKVVVEDKGYFYHAIEGDSRAAWAAAEPEEVMVSQSISLVGDQFNEDLSDEVRITDPQGNEVSPPGGEFTLHYNYGGRVSGVVDPIPVYEDHVSGPIGPVAYVQGWSGAPSSLTMARVPRTRTMNIAAALDILREAGLVDD
jgi:hypothetical protein